MSWRQRIIDEQVEPVRAALAGAPVEAISFDFVNCLVAVTVPEDTDEDVEDELVGKARAATAEHAVQRLLASGVVVTDPTGLRVGFSHQSLYEFARARSFLREEAEQGQDLASFILQRRASIFSRPTIWSALNYLRAADRGRI